MIPILYNYELSFNGAGGSQMELVTYTSNDLNSLSCTSTLEKNSCEPAYEVTYECRHSDLGTTNEVYMRTHLVGGTMNNKQLTSRMISFLHLRVDRRSTDRKRSGPLFVTLPQYLFTLFQDGPRSSIDSGVREAE